MTELFLLLSALICGITGTVRTVVVRAPEIVVASQVAGVAIGGMRAAAVRAYALTTNRIVAPRPDGYVTPAVLVLTERPLVSFSRLVPERRRE
ncbi:hypothetical protein LZK98_14425 [Sphingomonas cannabina]|uniref:hypothetical protein n=1 Tax=Sphingomonas cannabina TaxID=2899123 RepID=UPI001F3D7D43|nr:hypothetical protein [Sphingomonas cannabina]UIJ44260.1 hypothetical protein LZK98_14425 [Sphingomonas cannabina]